MWKVCADCDKLLGYTCEACRLKQEEIRRERNEALAFRPQVDELSDSAQALLARGALSRAEAGLEGGLRRSLAMKNPARREVFRLLGIYLPEHDARKLLREVSDYMWIQAEKAGCDIWQVLDQRQPFAAGAREWARRYLQAFTVACDRRNTVAA